MPDAPDPIMNRRHFFNTGLRRLLQRAAEMAAPLERMAEKLSELEGPTRPVPKPDARVPLDQQRIE